MILQQILLNSPVCFAAHCIEVNEYISLSSFPQTITSVLSKSFDIFLISIPELTDSHIFEVSERVTRPRDVRRLGVELGLPQYAIESLLRNNLSDINEAAYRILQAWYKTQIDKREAFTKLFSALECAEMHHLVHALNNAI